MLARRILRIQDLTDRDIDTVLATATEYANGASHIRTTRSIVGLAFLEPSLRTRAGFLAAAHRIGASVIEVDARRESEISMAESVADTIRILSGYVDALVVRSSQPSEDLARTARQDTAWLNAGDRGAAASHPSQALLDLFAIERLRGPIEHQHVALCGDLRSRAARSLLDLLARRQPRGIALLTDSSLLDGFKLPSHLEPITEQIDRDGLSEVTAMYVVGIPHGGADEAVRSKLRLDRAKLALMRPDAIVLSPMPIIDEIASPARLDARMRYFEQSDLAVHVRAALLGLMFGAVGCAPA